MILKTEQKTYRGNVIYPHSSSMGNGGLSTFQPALNGLSSMPKARILTWDSALSRLLRELQNTTNSPTQHTQQKYARRSRPHHNTRPGDGY